MFFIKTIFMVEQGFEPWTIGFTDQRANRYTTLPFISNIY